MNFHVFVTLLLSAVHAYSRGPHHPHGQTPVLQKHHHYQPSGKDSLTAETQVLQDTEHLHDDMEFLSPELIDKMSPEELKFLYFTTHDYDGNQRLDGHELLTALYHTVDHDDDGDAGTKDINHFIHIVDKTLEEDDEDNDGLLTYIEYKTGSSRRNDKPLLDIPPQVVEVGAGLTASF